MSVYFIVIGLLLTIPSHFSEGNTQTEEKNNYLEVAVRRLIQRNYPEIFLDEKTVEKKDTETVENEDELINKQVLLDTKEGDTEDGTGQGSKLPDSTASEPPTPVAQAIYQSDKESGPNSHIIGIPRNDFFFITITTACSLAAFIGLVIAGVCWYKLHKNVKAASEVEYPAYGVTGPAKERMPPPPGDRKLAQSAQMYHYQHQKQQMIAMEKANGEMKHDASEDESEEENEEGDYTVYECPGLAPTGEMEVRNPLFTEETPAAPGPEQSKEPQ